MRCNAKQLRSYIETVISDACKSENRPNDVTFDAFLIDHKALLLLLNCKYLRVRRKVYYRIINNLNKRFGLTVVETEDMPTLEGADYYTTSYADAGYTVADIKVGKQHYFISASCGGSAVEKVHELLRDGDSGKCEEFQDAMKSVGGKQFYHDNLDTAFGQYCSDYARVFGKEVPIVSVQKV